MKAFKFWYMMDKNSRVEYIYIIAMSLSQARQIFFDNYLQKYMLLTWGKNNYII